MLQALALQKEVTQHRKLQIIQPTKKQLVKKPLTFSQLKLRSMHQKEQQSQSQNKNNTSSNRSLDRLGRLLNGSASHVKPVEIFASTTNGTKSARNTHGTVPYRYMGQSKKLQQD